MYTFSYSFTEDFNKGFYWSSFPINIETVVNNEEEGDVLFNIFTDAKDQWETASGESIWNSQNDFLIGLSSSNSIRWSDNFSAETGYDSQSTLAVTIRYSNGSFINQTEIVLNGAYPGMRSNDNGILSRVVLHELGHTIGLDHSNKPSVMQASLSHHLYLQDDDIEGVNALIDETLNRQSSNFISPLSSSSSSSSKLVSCGNVFLSKNKNMDSIFFVLSLLLGFILSAQAKSAIFLTKKTIT